MADYVHKLLRVRCIGLHYVKTKQSLINGWNVCWSYSGWSHGISMGKKLKVGNRNAQILVGKIYAKVNTKMYHLQAILLDCFALDNNLEEQFRAVYVVLTDITSCFLFFTIKVLHVFTGISRDGDEYLVASSIFIHGNASKSYWCRHTK